MELISAVKAATRENLPMSQTAIIARVEAASGQRNCPDRDAAV